MEHSKQIDRHLLRPYEGNDFFSERNYLGNSSYGSEGGGGGAEGFGGNGNVIYNSNGNSRNPDRYNTKKVGVLTIQVCLVY